MYLFLLAEFTLSKQPTSLETCHFKLEVITILDGVARLWPNQFILLALPIITSAILAYVRIITVITLNLWVFVRPLRQLPTLSTHDFPYYISLSLLVEAKSVMHFLNELLPHPSHGLLVSAADSSVHTHHLLWFSVCCSNIWSKHVEKVCTVLCFL